MTFIRPGFSRIWDLAFFVLLTLSALSAQAQCMIAPVPLEERVAKSPAIIIGRVTDQSPFIDRTTGGVQTLSRVEVVAWLKGGRAHKVAIITPGGVLGDQATLVFPSLELEVGRTYILFLDVEEHARADLAVLQREPRLRQSYAYADSQGALTFDKGRYHDVLVLPPLSEGQALDRIARLTGKPARTPGGDIYRARDFTMTLSAPIIPTVVSGMSPNPTNAGTIVVSEFLTITGSAFGASPGTVSFANADDGGSTTVTPPNTSDYVSWADASITVKVPRRAGTGTVTVNGSDVAPAPLTINYSLIEINNTFSGFATATRQRYYLRNLNAVGGYTFQYNSTSGFSANAAAVAAFERALQSWRCSTFIHFTRTMTTTTTGLATDGNSVVLFDASLPAGVLGRATSRFAASSNGSCNLENTVWWLREVDVQFKPDPPVTGFTWQFGPGAPSGSQFDFESVAVHELGHGHGLGHRIAAGEVMHFAISNGSAIRTPFANEVAGGNAKMAYSTAATCFNPSGSGTPMIALSNCSFLDDPSSPDDDGDGFLDAADCAPSDPVNWAVPANPVSTFTATKSGGNVDFSWTAPANPGTTTPKYDVLRSASASSFSSAVCVASNITGLSTSDALAGGTAYYIVRAESSCGTDGSMPSAPACP